MQAYRLYTSPLSPSFLPFFKLETNLFRANYCSVFQPASLKDVSRSINEIAELTAIAKS